MSKFFKNTMSNIKGTKSMDQVRHGSSYLGKGTHDVVVEAVDSEKIEEGRVSVTFTAGGKSYTDRMFVFSQNNDELSFAARMLLAGCLPSTEAFEKFFEVAEDDDRVFEYLTGMKLSVSLDYGKGVRIESTAARTFVGINEDDERVTDEYPTFKEVKEVIESTPDLKRAYLRIVGTQATHGDENIAAFYAAVEAKKTGKTIKPPKL